MLTHESLTSRIIAAAYRVHNDLGSGFLEHIYGNGLLHELRRDGLRVEPHPPVEVLHRGVVLGYCITDLLVEGFFVVEIKAQESILRGHLSQTRAYLRCSGKESGMVINFGPVKVEVRRVENGRKREERA